MDGDAAKNDRIASVKSGAIGHFPTVVHQNGKKMLWNRLEKKTLENLPEERVRLRYIDYLNLECGWPASRIASEVPLSNKKTIRSSGSGNKSRRADLICYDKQLRPEILVECKAESVKLDNRTALQTARYNLEVRTGKISITNGIEDFWFRITDAGLSSLSEPPLAPVSGLATIRSDFQYWSARGFAGRDFPDEKKMWLTRLLTTLWSDQRPWDQKYLTFPQQLPGLQFNHEYRILSIDKPAKLKAAFTILSGIDGQTYMTAIFNRAGENRAVLVSNLQKILTGSDTHTTLYTTRAEEKLNIFNHISPEFLKSPEKLMRDLPGYLASIVSII